MELKNTLKKHRQDKGLTQEELASMLGVSRQTIISIERYRYKPSLELGLKISNLLDTKFFYPSTSYSDWAVNGVLGRGRSFLFTLGYEF